MYEITMNKYMPRNLKTWVKYVDFLKHVVFPKLNQEEVGNLNRLVITSKIEAIITKLPTHKSSGPYDVTGKFYQIFNEEMISILFKLFQEN